MKACYFGPLRLWREARYPVVPSGRGHPLQTHVGVDQPKGMIVGNSGNILVRADVCTFGRPHPTYYTQEAWIGLTRKLQMALDALAGEAHPLAWVSDTTKGGTVLIAGGLTIVTTTAHGLVAGDRVLVRRSPSSAYAVRTVQTVPDTVTVNLSTNLSPLTPMAGDDVLRISSLWDPMWFDAMPEVRPSGGSKGHYYSPEIHFTFQGSPVTEYHRVDVDLDT